VKHWAIVSIGTNSTRALIADMQPEIPRVELSRSIGTRIGEGLSERGHLGEEPMQRTLDALRDHFRALRGHYIRLYAIATSALRRADNGDVFAEAVHDLVGVPLGILTGDEEAAGSYRGAITAFGQLHHEEVGVIDTGGGSTEYAIGAGPSPERTVSCEIGAVRLTEAVPELAGRDSTVDLDTIERARKIARNALAPMADFRSVERLAFVGGSATTAAQVAFGKKTKMDRVEMTRGDMQRALVRLCGMTYKERREIAGMKPHRADILPAGIIVLETALDILGHDRAVTTTADLLVGYLLQQRDRQPMTARAIPH
jgi:exopolyphosphatase/guanosine-5'-triphosphate,3'-diphosphate pyrophosphatase